jgi:carbon starvation protein
MIQGWLSVIFVVLSIIVIITALVATMKAFRNARDGVAHTDHEDPAVPSRAYAPSGFIPTPAERELMAEWDKLPADLRLEKSAHH